MSCIAGLYNITCDKGATFSRSITWTNSAKRPHDLTGYTARMHVRSTVDAPTTLVMLTTENSRISLGGVAGTINLLISATDTTNFISGKYVYDLEVVSGGGVVDRIIEGNFIVKPEVTR